MIKLLAKNQLDGEYYFEEGDNSVYRIKLPLAESQKEYIDSLETFLRKSIDTTLTYDEKEFKNLQEFRTFAIQDCSPEERGITLKKQESYDDLLIYASVEIVEEYFDMIEDKIKNKEFIGLDLFFKQLSINYELLENKYLFNKLEELRIAYDNARFPEKSKIFGSNRFGIIKSRIKKERTVLSFA